MSELQDILYNAMTLPIDICNVIALYVNCIEQVYCNDSLYYKYNNALIEYNSHTTYCIINDTMFTFIINNDVVEIKRYDKRNIIASIYLNIGTVYSLKYGNNLIADCIDEIIIYKVIIENTDVNLIQLYKIKTRGCVLYADANYIITTECSAYGLILYNNTLTIMRNIENIYHRVYAVALIDGVLSYNMLDEKWHAILTD